jgi:4,5-dihydroxyphthalate decarboxylase
MSNDSNVLTLRTLLGDYPNTLSLKNGEVRPTGLVFDFADVKVPNTAFKDVVRHLKYDVAELAIVTYLQARVHGKPLVLLPAVVVGALPHPFLVYNAERGQITPADLKGRRIGIRAYSVTTAAWVRGILQNDHGVDLDSIKWVTFEDPHVANIMILQRRARLRQQQLTMLLDGEIEAGVVGGADLKDKITPVIPNPTKQHKPGANARARCRSITWLSSRSRWRNQPIGRERNLPRASRKQTSRGGKRLSIRSIQVNKVRRNGLINEYSVQQGLIPRRFEVDELFDETTRGLH